MRVAFFDMLDALDRQDPDGLIEVVPGQDMSRHHRWSSHLTQLMTIKVEKYIPGKKGKLLKKVEETSLAGLTFAADDHAGPHHRKRFAEFIDQTRRGCTHA